MSQSVVSDEHCDYETSHSLLNLPIYLVQEKKSENMYVPLENI